MARKRLSRKELVQQDEITSTLRQATSFTMKHTKTFLIVAVGLVALLVLGVGWRLYASNVEAAAQAELARAIRIYTDTLGYATDEERFQAALEEAERVAATYPDLPAGQIARYYAALSQSGLGDYEAADGGFEILIETGEAGIRQVARYALAESKKKRGDLEGAISVFEEIIASGGYAGGAVLVELGRLSEALSRHDEARTHYEALVAEYPDSPFRADADRALKRLGEAAERPETEEEES